MRILASVILLSLLGCSSQMLTPFPEHHSFKYKVGQAALSVVAPCPNGCGEIPQPPAADKFYKAMVQAYSDTGCDPMGLDGDTDDDICTPATESDVCYFEGPECYVLLGLDPFQAQN